MKKLFTNSRLQNILGPLLILIFFVPYLVQFKIPIPGDAVVGLYHPWRDESFGNFTAGKFPIKNPLITDPILQIYPWKSIVVDNFKLGNLPLWNPYNFSGQPLLANIQSSSFQILNIAYLVLPFKIGWAIQVILPLLLTAGFMYLFLKSLKLGPLASTFGAVILPFSGFFVAWLTWGNISTTAMWLPLILFLTNKLLVKSNPLFFLFLTFSIFQVIVSGHWQTAFYILLTFFIFVFFSIQQGIKLRNIFTIILALIFGILLAAPQVLPSLEFINFSNRQIDQGFAEGKLDWFLPIAHLIQIIVPDFFGNPATYNYWGVWNYAEFVGFTGTIPFIFAFIALFSKNKNKYFFVALVSISLLLALENPISKIPYVLDLPLMSSMQPSRIIFLLTFSFSALAAIGFNHLLIEKFKKSFIYLPIALLVILFTLLLTTKFANEFFPIENHLDTANIAFRNLAFPIGIVLASFCLFTCLIFKFPKKIVISMLFLLTIAELFRFTNKFTPFFKTSDIFPPSEVTNFLQNQKRPFRVITTDRRLLHPNTNSVYKIESVQGYDPLYLTKYAKLVSSWESGKVSEAGSFNRIVTPMNYDSTIADLLNVRYILSFDEISHTKLSKVFEKGSTKVYENRQALPRFFFAEEVKKVESENQELEKILDPDFDITKSAVSSTYEFEKSTTNTAIDIQKYSDQFINLSVFTQKETPLITSSTYYPGWNVYIDGNKKEIKRANFMFQSVIVPEGNHTIEFKYEPESVYNGFRLAGFGLILTLLTSIYLWRVKYQ